MRNRDIQSLMPLMEGIAALKDMLGSDELQVVMDSLSKATEAHREAEKAAQQATVEREQATKACEDATAELEDRQTSMDKQAVDLEQREKAVIRARTEFDEYRDAENDRLNAWEQRLQSIPDTSDKLERKLAAAERREARAAALEEQYTNRVVELGLQPV